MQEKVKETANVPAPCAGVCYDEDTFITENGAGYIFMGANGGNIYYLTNQNTLDTWFEEDGQFFNLVMTKKIIDTQSVPSRKERTLSYDNAAFAVCIPERRRRHRKGVCKAPQRQQKRIFAVYNSLCLTNNSIVIRQLRGAYIYESYRYRKTR